MFVEKGEDKLLSALQKVKPRCGYARTSTSLGWDIYYARETPLPGRRAEDRPRHRPAGRHVGGPQLGALDGLPVLARRDPPAGDGKGQGKAIPAAKLTLNKERNTLEIENYEREPVRLNEITVIEPKKN